ncbi:MAG: hypothetical protein H0U20_10050, partial [Thermoleophilaceae bacterium]|nr:hypothetical protein [Thermoleophilaceae bacterium]
FLHSNPMPFTAGPGQEKENECEAGNERYVVGRQAIGNPPGVQGTKTEVTRSEVVQSEARR